MTVAEEYRDILKRELIERCHRNPKYSLRAFARDLKFAPARLSDVLNGKKGLSRAAALSVAKVLGMSESETARFCDLVDSQHGRSHAAREQAQKRLAQSPPQAHSLTIDAFRVIADWYHFAILELLKLDNYRNDLSWMAKALDLTELQVSEALGRLERLELIEKRKSRYHPTGAYVSSPDGVPSEALKKFHEQLLKKALDALYLQSVEERDFSAMLMPVALKDVPLARRRIRDFSRKLCKELTSVETVDSVYSLSVQFVNFTPSLTKRSL